MTDRLVQIFAEVLDCAPSTLNDQSSPDNVPAWDSVASMALVAAVEEGFGVELTTREIVAMRTLALVRQVLRRKGIHDV